MAEGTPNIKANKTYSADFKLKVIESAKSTNNSVAGRAHHVDVRCVRRWRKQEKLIKRQVCEGAKTRVRLPGGGKKPRSHEMEEILFDWIISMSNEEGWAESNKTNDQSFLLFDDKYRFD